MVICLIQFDYPFPSIDWSPYVKADYFFSFLFNRTWWLLMSPSFCEFRHGFWIYVSLITRSNLASPYSCKHDNNPGASCDRMKFGFTLILSTMTQIQVIVSLHEIKLFDWLVQYIPTVFESRLIRNTYSCWNWNWALNSFEIQASEINWNSSVSIKHFKCLQLAAQDLLLSMFCPCFASRRHGAMIDLNSGKIKNKKKERK